jgi:hypothetical protein
VWCLGYTAPRIDHTTWDFARWDWPQAVRLSEFSRRLGADVRGLLATRPESLVVVYRVLPTGCLFQTEDGPATRECLRDPTVRAYYFRGLPMRVDREHLAILVFDPDSMHLVSMPHTFASAIENSSHAVMCGNGWPAYAFASFADTAGAPRFALLYMCAAARLIEEGPLAYLQGLAEAGVTDTTGPTPEERAYAMIPRTVPVGVALAGALRHPLTAAAHSAYGVRLEERDFLVSAGVEYRIAVTLDPGRVEDRLRLATILMGAWPYRELARAELERVRSDAPNTEAATRARTLIEWLEVAGAGPPARRGG